jgi:hypothetical protein
LPRSKGGPRYGGQFLSVANNKTVKSPTAADAVLTVIGRAKKGAGTAAIKEKTGYNQKKVANIIFKLKKQGKIKTLEKGVYTKA